MHSVADALQIVLSHCQACPPVDEPLSHAALGQVLAEDVISDIDMPPFDRAVMDGYAVRADDLASGSAELTVLEEINAGKVPTFPLAPRQCSRIMTGAPLPIGADAIVIVERSTALPNEKVRLDDRPKLSQHIMSRGDEVRKGDVVIPAGSVLRPQEFGMLAMLGRASASLHPRPRVAIAATGDELVEAPLPIGPGQIRNSNAPMLMAQTARVGAQPHYLGIGRDRAESLKAVISRGLENADVLILSGGVSAGTHDLVPGVLQEQGVTAHLHKVRLKPGKPFFFGTHESLSGKRLVFGLPGNPVSSLVCFELFIRPALRRLAGLVVDPSLETMTLLEPVISKSDRPTYLPASTEADGVRAVPWLGSSDLRAFLRANALLVLPEGESRHEAGARLQVMRLS